MRKEKVIAYVLAFVLLLGMLPKNIVLAEENEAATFDDAKAVHDENMSTFWSTIEAFYGPDEETPGSLGRYMEARDSFADNVEELYANAVAGRAACVTAYSKVEASYTTALEFYEQLEESEKEDAETIEWKNAFDEGFADATNVIESLEEVPPIVDDMETVYIDGDGNLHGNPNAPVYWKVSEEGLLTVATENDYSLKIEKGEDCVEMYMHNFQFTSAPEYDSDAFWSEFPLVIHLEGTNHIIADKGNALGVIGGLTVEGTGSLELKATSEQIVPENGDEPYTPMALFVVGTFTNHAVLTCDSKNTDNTVFIDCEAKDIVNTGSISVGENQKIATIDIRCDEFVKPENYSNSADYPVPTDHVYVGKVYYYTPDIMYPNTIYGHDGDSEQWTVYGNYDEDGNPIGSNVWYQYWYVDERGGILTEDLVNPTQYLVYEENPESLIVDKDIVSVSDGEAHVFDADLYALWFTDGDVTVNGNIIQDFACFNVAERVPAATGDYFEYVFDGEGNRVWLEESKPDSKVVVSGDVGLLSLSDSFAGDVTVNGNVSLIGFYEDMDDSVKTTLDPVPENFYGSKAEAGDIIVDGEFAGVNTEAIEGFLGYCVFNTEDFYTQTERTIDGEEVHGTVAAIHEDALLIDVTKNAAGETTWPCVKETDSSREDAVKNVLTDTDSKLIVMDISLIQDNEKKVEPSTTLNLYFDDVTGFTTPAVYHIKDNGEIEKLFVYDGTGEFGGSITCPTNSFSTYFIAEDQELKSNSINGNISDAPVTPPADDPVTPPADDPVTPPTDDIVTPPADDIEIPPSNEHTQEQNNSIEQVSPVTGEMQVPEIFIWMTVISVMTLFVSVVRRVKR